MQISSASPLVDDDPRPVFKLQIGTGNDDITTPYGIAHMLRNAADRIEAGSTDLDYEYAIVDINGNKVGTFAYRTDQEV